MIPLENLCKDSIGTNLYLNAKMHTVEGDSVAALLFEAASDFLEVEKANTDPKSPERIEILKKLKRCYGALCVESSYPPYLRIVKLPEDWGHYITKRCEVSRELEEIGYQE